ncbi:MAG: MFS transporter [Promethearchaeota archaeon]
MGEIEDNIENSKNLHEDKKKIIVKKLGIRTSLVLWILGLSGQIAWAVENTWFNTFVYDKLTPNPAPVAWMVVLSAFTATITTLFMGSLSDRTKSRLGRRRPYILFGYILWGIVTIIFPEPALLKNIGIAIVLVVILDSVMTFFGSTANDAAFSAWSTDISDSTNRGRVQGILSASSLLANLIALGVAGIIIDEFGYFVFFYILGGSVSILGGIAGLILKEAPISDEEISQTKTSVFIDIIHAFSPSNIKKQKILYLLFTFMAISGIGMQVYFPYLFIYLEHNLGFSKTMISIAGIVVITFGTLISIVVGMTSHKYNRKSAMIILTILSSINLLILSIFRNMWMVIAIYAIQISIDTANGIFLMAWIQDNYPKGEIGKFQGVRLIFMVAFPMMIGAPIGSLVIQNLGAPGVIDGKNGMIPTWHSLVIAAIIAIFALIPLLFIPKSAGNIKTTENADNI